MHCKDAEVERWKRSCGPVAYAKYRASGCSCSFLPLHLPTMEVFAEQEFAGGWFKEIWFAVYDRRNEGNFEIFRDMFDGKIIGQKQFST